MKQILTQGSIGKAIILFSLPMIAGNLFQQLYNVVDTLIVGQTIGSKALAAVGSSYALMVLLTSIILGLCMGSSVVFSQLFGAKKEFELKTSIVNAFVLVFSITVIICLISYLLLDQFLYLLQIPQESFQYTKEYLQVILSGMIFVFLYNFFTAILRSVGNTFVPLIILVISAIINIILDLVLILNFQMGVSGAALATVIAQGVSALFVIVYFFIRERELFPNKDHLHYRKDYLYLIGVNSFLTAIQQSIMNFGILLIQGLVNSFGYLASAAFAIVVKIDAFAYLPAQDFGNAFATYVAQNYGANQPDRIKQGFRLALIYSSGFCILASILVLIFAKQLMLLFVKPNELEIISIGITYLHIEGAFYIGIGILFLLYGFYRGLAKSMISIILTILSLGSRVLFAYALSSIGWIGMIGIWLSIPIGWGVANLYGLLFYHKHKDMLLNITNYK